MSDFDAYAPPIPVTSVLAALVREAAGALGAHRGTLFLLDRARGLLVSRVAEAAPELVLPLDEGVAGEVARTGVLAVVGGGDPRIARRFEEQTGFRVEDLLAAPVRAPGGAIVGVLELLNRGHTEVAQEEAHAVRSVCARLGAALDATSLGPQLTREGPRPLVYGLNRVVAFGPAMAEVGRRVARAAPTDATVLVIGETGTGKELIARALHANSARSDRPFVKVDCAALPAALIENELFGHERGAFTGADQAVEGRVAAAEGGTLFFDEVGELPVEVQGKILRLIQDRTYLRVGGTRERKADVRFLAATHVDLEAAVAARTFRADLYYRLRVVPIHVPPLRSRGAEDVDRLVDHLFHGAVRRHGRTELTLSATARRALHAHPWPGNVRELENVLESAVILAEGPVIGPGDLELVAAPAPAPATGAVSQLAATEAEAIGRALLATRGNRSEAARRLGISRSTLLRRLRG